MVIPAINRAWPGSAPNLGSGISGAGPVPEPARGPGSGCASVPGDPRLCRALPGGSGHVRGGLERVWVDLEGLVCV